VPNIIASDRCVSARLIEELSGIPKHIVHRIFTKDLGKRKNCAQFVLHALLADEKHGRVEHFKDFLKAAQNDAGFLKSIITGNETWCFQYEPLTKRQSTAWLSPKKPKPKRVRMQKSRVKTLMTVFFDSKGIVHKEFVLQGQNVNGKYYLGVLRCL
jgi:hypothetical protein